VSDGVSPSPKGKGEPARPLCGYLDLPKLARIAAVVYNIFI